MLCDTETQKQYKHYLPSKSIIIMCQLSLMVLLYGLNSASAASTSSAYDTVAPLEGGDIK